MEIKERLKEFIAYKAMSVRQFCISIDVSTSYVNNISKSIQPEKILRISQHYPELNIGWLLIGDGNMLKSNTAGAEEKVVVDKKILDTIISQQETMRNQQRLLEKIIDAKFQSPVQTENPAGCAGAAGA